MCWRQAIKSDRFRLCQHMLPEDAGRSELCFISWRPIWGWVLIAGILAGLFGIGGGLIIVPMLVICLTWQGIPQEYIMHLALGTSMASIIFTSVSSFWAHHRRGAVQWLVVRRIVPGILVGTFLGTCVAARLSSNFLKVFFVVFLYYVAVQMLIDKKPKPSRELPGQLGMFGVGNVIGVSLQPRRHRWRHPFRTLYDVVQSSRPPCDRDFSRHRFPHCHCRNGRLHLERVAGVRAAGILLRLYLSPGAGGHRRRQRLHGATGSAIGPQPPGCQA